MHLEINNIGKRYHNQWLFRHVSISLNTGQSLSITGRNGSGKSTLMQIVYGLVQASEGEVKVDQKEHYEAHTIFAMTAPYMELPLEFSINEIHDLYLKNKKTKIELDAFLAYSGFNTLQASKAVKLFSSGMLQRLKTALCLSSTAEILLLDEPLTNMDKEGENWYKNCISDIGNRIVLIAGNNPEEYAFTNTNLQINSGH